MRWGRCVCYNIQIFIQFQLTVNTAAIIINFVAAIASGKDPLTAVQLLWVNLEMDTLGALALATEKPRNDLMKMPPAGGSEPLITVIMWRNIIAQALYQVTIMLILQFKGVSIFGVDKKVKSTLIINTFVLFQVFNKLNARKLEKKNVFTGLLTNKMFLEMIGITIIIQVIMVESLEKVCQHSEIGLGAMGCLQWTCSIVMAYRLAYQVHSDFNIQGLMKFSSSRLTLSDCIHMIYCDQVVLLLSVMKTYAFSS